MWSGNYWLNIKMKKDLHKQIDELAMDVWGSDGTLGDLFAMLNDEQTQFLFDMKLKNFESDDGDLSLVFEVIDP
jgi:hypothetical protein